MIPRFWVYGARYWRTWVRLDLLIAILTGFVLAVTPEIAQLESRYELIMATQIGVAVSLLGLVLAGLSIVVAFLSGSLMAIMDAIDDGLSEDVWPFSFAALLAFLTATVSLGALILVPADNSAWIRASVGVTWALFFWTVSSTLSLIRVVYEYGKVRAAASKNLEN